MALPIDGRAFNNLISTTIDAKLERLVDNFFGRNALILRLLQRQAAGEATVRYEGGAEIRSTILYNQLPANSYGAGSTFFTGETEFMTDLVFQWHRAYAPINIDNLKLRQNMGPARVINYVEALVKNAVMSLKQKLGAMLYGDGTGNNGLDWDGLGAAVATTGTYGGITRNSTVGDPGNAIKASVNAVGGPVSLAMLQNSFGNVTFDDAKPDLIVTTQTIWNAIWNRVQPQDRNAPGPLRDVGFETIRFNGAEIVVDDNCPTGNVYLLNTGFIELWLMEGMDFVRRGQDFGPNGFPVYNQDYFVDQIVVYGDLVVPGPRFQGLIQNVTA